MAKCEMLFFQLSVIHAQGRGEEKEPGFGKIAFRIKTQGRLGHMRN